MDNYPVSSRSLEKHYFIDGGQFGQQYKEHHKWDQKEHAQEWMIFPDNVGEQLSIDETSLSNGEMYTIVTNKVVKGQKGVLVAMIKGTKSETIIERLLHIPERLRKK